MSEASSGIIIAVVVSILAPSLLAYMTNRQRRQEKVEDYARQDLVARRAEDHAANLAQSQAVLADQASAAAALLVRNNEAVAETAAETQKQLGVIHTLVNSNMTMAMQSEAEAVERELAMMREVVALRQAAGSSPSAESIGAIAATEAKLSELQATLRDRLRQQAIVDAQASVTKAPTVMPPGAPDGGGLPPPPLPAPPTEV